MPATSMRQNVATAQPDQASSRKRKRDPADQSELEALPSNVSDETRIDECSKSILSGWERGLVKLNDRRRIDKDKKAKKNKKAKKTEEGEGPTRHIICTSPSDYEAALSLRSPLASQLFMTMRWITWYYKACLNYFNYKNRQAKLGESSMGAILINTILNELLGTPEIWTRAFMVLAVFAMVGFKVSTPGRLREGDRQRLIETVTSSLCERLKRLPQDYELVLPCPARWIASTTKEHSFEYICEALGFPKLTLLKWDQISQGTDVNFSLQQPQYPVSCLTDRPVTDDAQSSTPGTGGSPRTPSTTETFHDDSGVDHRQFILHGTLESNQKMSLLHPREWDRNIKDPHSSNSGMIRSLSPPLARSVLEDLLMATKDYFEISCQKMKFNEDRHLLDPSGTKSNNGLCNDFDSYCFTATQSKGDEFRLALSEATRLIPQILQVEHPRSLPCFLEVFIHLGQVGMSDVAHMLRAFIRQWSVVVIRERKLWLQMCQLLGDLEKESLEGAMPQIWKCITDTVNRSLEPSHPLAVSIYLDYVKRVHGATDLPEEERRLRDTFTICSSLRVRLNLAHNLNRQLRHADAELEVHGVMTGLHKGQIVEWIECYKALAHSQFGRGDRNAKQTMEMARKLIKANWGPQHPWYIEFGNVLRVWLEGWGEMDDAARLRAEVEGLMKGGFDDRREGG